MLGIISAKYPRLSGLPVNEKFRETPACTHWRVAGDCSTVSRVRRTHL